MTTNNYSINWYDAEHTIIYLHVFDKWNWDTVQEMSAQEYLMIESVTCPVEYGQLPDNAVQGIWKVIRSSHKREALVNIITNNNGMKSVYDVVATIFNIITKSNTIHFVTTMNEALSLIEEYEQTSSQTSRF